MMAQTVPIPAWNALGLLPPVNEAQPTASDASRSPYPVALAEVVQRFAISTERRAILRGWLRYRQALHAVGLVRGFQWLDGSFLEHVEVIEQRAPQDMDVVTFFHVPAGVTQQALVGADPGLFQHQSVKRQFALDGYLISLGKQPDRLVSESAYWYGMWSHRRNQAWKGFLQVDLAPADEAAVLHELAQQGDSV